MYMLVTETFLFFRCDRTSMYTHVRLQCNTSTAKYALINLSKFLLMKLLGLRVKRYEVVLLPPCVSDRIVMIISLNISQMEAFYPNCFDIYLKGGSYPSQYIRGIMFIDLALRSFRTPYFGKPMFLYSTDDIKVIPSLLHEQLITCHPDLHFV